jgi:hypothetical protein
MLFDPAAAWMARQARALAAAALCAALCLGGIAWDAAAEEGPPDAGPSDGGQIDGAPPETAPMTGQPQEPASGQKVRESLRGLNDGEPGAIGAGIYAPAPTDAVLLSRLCAQNLLANEEDRIFGLISLAVRATVRYENAPFAADVIDDAEQDALDALLKDCSQITATDEAHRLGIAIDAIREATLKVMVDHRRPDYRAQRSFDTATAADLSEELTSEEIDAWLDGLSPRERAFAVFLYASDVNAQEIADAVGVPVEVLNRDVAMTKIKLLSYFREEDNPPAPGMRNIGPAIQYRLADASVAAMLHGDPPQPDPVHGDPVPGHPAVTLRITGISSDLYAGWSLLAIANGMPPDQTLEVKAPFIVAAEGGGRRMIVDGVAEITAPDQPVRRFLLKAYAIDGDTGGVGFHDTLHISADRVDNPQALVTLHNPELSNIEIARCLWHDYGKMPDPGLCR